MQDKGLCFVTFIRTLKTNVSAWSLDAWDLGGEGISLITFSLFLQKGNIFIFDAKIIDRIPVRDYNGKPLQVTPGLCLLYVNSDKKLLPVAIQVWHFDYSVELYGFILAAIHRIAYY